MNGNISPEEKLLRLIKGDKKKIKEFPAGTHRFIPTLKYPISLNIRKIIKAVFIISCIFLIFTFIYPFISPEKIELPKAVTKEGLPPETELKPQPKPYDFYSEGIRNRQIFGERVSPETAKPLSIVSSDLTKDINLIGVILGDNPQAIIEDKKTQKNYYVTKGQFIGEFQVEDIQEGKVILIYEGQKFELYL